MSFAIAAFISPHGFGHAARLSAVLHTLRGDVPDLHVHLFTKVPEWFFAESLQHGYTYHPLLTDVGLAQKTALEEDLPETLISLKSLLPFDPELCQTLADTVIGLGCRWVLCDIAPMGIAVAQRAGLPSVLVENFTWDWIYEAYADDWPQLRPYIQQMSDWFAQADYRIQAVPVCRPIAERDDFKRVGPIARSLHQDRDAVRNQLGIDQDEQLVLITMGGMAWHFDQAQQVADLAPVRFLFSGKRQAQQTVPANVHFLNDLPPIYHPDLVAACDAVLGKVGYSTLAEVYQAGIPYGCVTRSRFPEAPVLIDFMQREMSGVVIQPAQFEDGSWIEAIPALLAQPRYQPAGENGAEAAARWIAHWLIQG